MKISKRDFLLKHKSFLDINPINSTIPIKGDDEEIYFITKLRPSLIKELIWDIRKGKEDTSFELKLYREGNKAIIRFDFIAYPFYLETEIGIHGKGRQYLDILKTQDKIKLILITEKGNGERRIEMGKEFNIDKNKLRFDIEKLL